MKNKNLIIRLSTFVIIVMLAACTASPAVQTTQPVVDTTEPVVIAATTEMPTATPTIEPSFTATLELPTATLEPTQTAIVELTNAAAALNQSSVVSSSGATNVFVTLGINTRCRKGPASNYSLVATIPADLKIPVLGRLAHDHTYYYIEVPDKAGTYCWVYAEGAAIEGDSGHLAVYTAPATPVPDDGMDFALSFNDVQICNGDDYSINFKVENTDDLVWQSIRVYIIDVDTKISTTYTSDNFEEYYNCHVDNIENALVKGDRVFIALNNPGHFDYNIYGGTFKLKVTLCSEDNLAGTCLTKEIKINP